MNQLELEDIQGIILRTYGTKKQARFLFLTINNVEGAKKWIGSVLGSITTVSDPKNNIYLNLAFTHKGMEVMGFSKDVIMTFPTEFTDGPLQPHKLRMLGDTRINDPKNWYWGGIDTADQIHMLLMVYTNTAEELEDVLSGFKTAWSKAGVSVYRSFETHLFNENKEHFGYRDGISQPIVEDFHLPDDKHGYLPESVVKAGEFVLGYKNEYGVYPTSPMIADDATDILTPSPLDPEKKDLGKNGSFMAFRQLEENVQGFWDFVKQSSTQHYGDDSIENLELIGAKIFGRWTNGAPITLYDKMPGEKENTENNFKYAGHDMEGLKCPVGAHARRANPRDSFNSKPANSMSLTKKHRLMRRARPYGQPMAESMQLKDIIASEITDKNRGIYFICFNADYARQFEFMQQAWMANPKFEDLYADPDPLLGNSELAHDDIPQYFTIPEKPIRKRLEGIQTFVTTRGSAYFFMPGKKALKYICEK